MENSKGVKKDTKLALFKILAQYLEIRPDIYDIKISEDKKLIEIMSEGVK